MPGSHDQHQTLLMSATSRGRRRQLRQITQRIRRGRGEFGREHRAGRCTLWQREAVQRSPILAALLQDPDAFIPRGEMLKDGGTATVVRLPLEEGSVVVKRYRSKGTLFALKHLLRTSRAWRFWRGAHWLRQAGIGAPEPLAMIEQRSFGLLRRAWVVYRYLEGEHLAQVHSTGDPPSAALARAVQQLFQSLQRAGFVHGDMKAQNLLLSGKRIHLADLDVLRYLAGWRGKAARRKDLHRFLNNWPPQSPPRQAYQAALSELL